MKGLKSQPIVITEDGIFDVQKYGEIISVSFKNQGTSNVTLWEVYNVPAGSPLLVLEGEIGFIRKDVVPVTFATGGVNNLVVFITTEA
ncbi:MAG: hypothetical protein NW207_04795 [Cytophagales bacterium]|nr:hypothetical protein [Cytophagales bacterium]